VRLSFRIALVARDESRLIDWLKVKISPRKVWKNALADTASIAEPSWHHLSIDSWQLNIRISSLNSQRQSRPPTFLVIPINCQYPRLS